jgi:nitrite reductase/ring-hydroxylating ferredoxin subunit
MVGFPFRERGMVSAGGARKPWHAAGFALSEGSCRDEPMIR